MKESKADTTKQKPAKKSTESLGLIKNRQAPKTFNKDKKVAWGKECPSKSSNRIYINIKKGSITASVARWYCLVAVAMPQMKVSDKATVEASRMREGFIPFIPR